MAAKAPLLPGLAPVGGKPVHLTCAGGRPTAAAGVLVRAQIERRRGRAERLARCIEDPRAPERVCHGVAEMTRVRARPLAAGYPGGNDREFRRADPGCKLARRRLPQTGLDLGAPPTSARSSAAIRQCHGGLREKAAGAGWGACPGRRRRSG
jgi:hypothetical protein